MSGVQISDCRFIRNVGVQMRDGVTLATSVYLPKQDGTYPVVLVRTAYNRLGLYDSFYPEHGIVFVVQDARGRYDSDGEHYPFVSEAADGRDTLEWIHEQPWCDGKVGMFGDSYLAATQFAAAQDSAELLHVLNPRFMAGDCWKRAYYCDGAFSLALTWSWLCFECSARTSDAAWMPYFDVASVLRTLPISDMDQATGLGEVPAYRDYVSRTGYDDGWKALNIREYADRFTMPVFLIGGWYDNYAAETIKNYLSIRENAPTPEIRDSHRMLIGPWSHGITGKSTLGELDFGIDAMVENDATQRWLDCMLHDGNAADFQEAPIRIFVMGANVWRDEYEWPPAGTRYVNYYLHSGGVLAIESPGTEPTDGYTYDPADPVPTRGGNHSIGPYNPGLYEILQPGPMDQRSVEERDDVHVYTSDILDEDTEVTGEVTVTLFAASSARDTDFVARLTDVYPDGRSICITEGVIRARWRESVWEEPKLMEPHVVYEFTIDLQVTSNVFMKGHRIRLDVTSSNFPLWDRNLNTGGDPGTGTEMVPAHQVIHHDATHPSHVKLPTIDRRE
jgi:uncharacterized protein